MANQAEVVDLKGRKKAVPSKGYIRAFELYELSRCRHCGRVLHAEASQKRGLGPGCAGQVADMYVNTHPAYVGETVKKRWTRPEIDALLTQVRSAGNSK
jgi:hypothetical protein